MNRELLTPPGLADDRYERNASVRKTSYTLLLDAVGRSDIMRIGQATCPIDPEHRCGGCDERKSLAVAVIWLSSRGRVSVSLYRFLEPLGPLG
jgi:hypothetical protein